MRDTLTKNPNLKNLVFDTTGTGYCEAGKKPPELADLNAALEKARVSGIRVTRLAEVELPKAEVVYEVQISGLA